MKKKELLMTDWLSSLFSAGSASLANIDTRDRTEMEELRRKESTEVSLAVVPLNVAVPESGEVSAAASSGDIVTEESVMKTPPRPLELSKKRKSSVITSGYIADLTNLPSFLINAGSALTASLLTPPKAPSDAEGTERSCIRKGEVSFRGRYGYERAALQEGESTQSERHNWPDISGC